MMCNMSIEMFSTMWKCAGGVVTGHLDIYDSCQKLNYIWK